MGISALPRATKSLIIPCYLPLWGLKFSAGAAGLQFSVPMLSEFYGMAIAGAVPWRSGFLSASSRWSAPTALTSASASSGSSSWDARSHCAAEPIRRLPPLPAGPVLAFPRYRLDQHLLRRLPAGDSLACRPRRNGLACRPRRTAGQSRLSLLGRRRSSAGADRDSLRPRRRSRAAADTDLCRHRRCGDHSGRRPPAVFYPPRLQTVVDYAGLAAYN
jgi:hypothetical protein